MWLGFLLASLICGVFAGYLAVSRYRGFMLGFMLGFIFGPLGVVITCLVEKGRPKRMYASHNMRAKRNRRAQWPRR